MFTWLNLNPPFIIGKSHEFHHGLLFKSILVGGLEHAFYFSIHLGKSSSQLTNWYFSEGKVYHQPAWIYISWLIREIIPKWPNYSGQWKIRIYPYMYIYIIYVYIYNYIYIYNFTIFWLVTSTSIHQPHWWHLAPWVYPFRTSSPAIGRRSALKYWTRARAGWCWRVPPRRRSSVASLSKIPHVVFLEGNWWKLENESKRSAAKNWLVVWNMALIFPFAWECHHPNWRTPSFFRGVGWNHQPVNHH